MIFCRAMVNPEKVLLFSGKRKCGKDFITDRLLERLGEKAVILRSHILASEENCCA